MTPHLLPLRRYSPIFSIGMSLDLCRLDRPLGPRDGARIHLLAQ